MKGVIGTAGHIDHGKTALIGALTGEQTDRLPEEQRRGISIDLGFSHLELDGLRLGVVDVPGHEDFIRNMLAGATGIDVLLLVVAADEGVMPQTREHTAIAELLGVDRAVVAVTKADLVDDDWLGLVHDDVAGFLAETPFAGAPMVPTSATTGAGLDELRQNIGHVFRGARGQADDLFRLPVDRAFTVRGTGTVVTGTVWSGSLQREAAVRLLPGGPDARVRSLQVHGQDVESVEAGERAAIALAGLDRDDVERGMTLVADAGWEPAHILTTRLRVLPGSAWSIEDRQRVRVHLGTAEVMARAVLLDREDALGPGEEAWAQLRLEAPLLTRARDRLVVRSYSPVATIGGGRVVEPSAPRRSRISDADRRLFESLLADEPAEAARALLLAAGTAGLPIEPIPVLTGAAPGAVEEALEDAVRAGSRVFAPAAHQSLRDRLVEEVTRHHERRHLEPGMDPEALRRACDPAEPALVQHALDGLLHDGDLESRWGRIALAEWQITLSDAEAALAGRVSAALAEAGAAPPKLDELSAALGDPAGLEAVVGVLERDGRLVRLEHDLFMDAEGLERIIAEIRSRFAGRSDLSPGDFREVVDVSRRHLMPLLAHLDAEGVTVRGGEGRAVPA